MSEELALELKKAEPLWEQNESYFQLVWRRFRRSNVSIIGGLLVITLTMLAIFADFFSPTNIYQINLKASFIPPQIVHFIDHEGKFHLRRDK
jgi:peptide/nickel transport system permease protein